MSPKKMREIEREGNGNTNSSPSRKEQPLQLKKWFFTFNNFEREDINILFEKFRLFFFKQIK